VKPALAYCACIAVVGYIFGETLLPNGFWGVRYVDGICLRKIEAGAGGL